MAFNQFSQKRKQLASQRLQVLVLRRLSRLSKPASHQSLKLKCPPSHFFGSCFWIALLQNPVKHNFFFSVIQPLS